MENLIRTLINEELECLAGGLVVTGTVEIVTETGAVMQIETFGSGPSTSGGSGSTVGIRG